MALFVLGGCAARKGSNSLPMETPESFSAGGSAVMTDKWWAVFEDEELNKMIDSALQSNFNLRSAWQRMKAARAIVDRESSSLFPDLEGFISGNVNRSRQEVLNYESLSLGLASSYEIDLWGRISSEIEAEEFRAEARLSDYRAAAISLAAEIVRTRYRLIEARKQLAIIDGQIETNQKVLELLKSRFGSGQVRSVDILRQQQLLESTLEQRTYAESDVRIFENQLAVLMGRAPQEGVDISADELPELPEMPESGVPSELIQRRPDVRSAFNLLNAADRDLASAISNQYPRMSISASVSTVADNNDVLFENWAYSLAGNLIAPIFYGGRLSAEVDRAEAVKQQYLYDYAQTVLTAFREVEDVLILEQTQSRSIKSIENQLKLARQSYEQLRVEYINGVTGYLDVLTALDAMQRLQRDQLSAKMLLLEYRIALYRALAGGFKTERENEIEE